MISGTRGAFAQAFRHAALPLGWYYALTLAVPLANGAAGGAFVNHAAVVLVVPPVVIVLAVAIRKSAQVCATAGRALLNGRW